VGQSIASGLRMGGARQCAAFFAVVMLIIKTSQHNEDGCFAVVAHSSAPHWFLKYQLCILQSPRLTLCTVRVGLDRVPLHPAASVPVLG
jgi:hypothetical protein